MEAAFGSGDAIFIESGQFKVKAVLCGIRPKVYLLASVIQGLGGVKLDSEIACRIGTEEACYGFESKIISVIPEFSLIGIFYPQNMTESNLRKSERFFIHIPIGILYKEMKNSCIINDLSIGGCGIICESDFPKNAIVKLSGMLFDNFVLSNLSGVIRRKDIYARGGWEYGIEFLINNDQDMDSVQKFIHLVDYIDKIPKIHDIHAKRNFIPEGEACQMQIGMQKLQSVFRGSNDKYFFTDIPIENGVPKAVLRNTISIIRFVAEGTAYAFESQLMKQLTTPFQACIWHSPDQIKHLDIRNGKRIKTCVGGKVVRRNEAQMAILLNLSPGGAMIATPNKNFDMDDKVFIKLNLPTGERIDNILCQVKHIVKQARITYLGLLFLEKDGYDYGSLFRYYEMLREKEL